MSRYLRLLFFSVLSWSRHTIDVHSSSPPCIAFLPGNATCLADAGPCEPPPACVPAPPYKFHVFTLRAQGFPGHPGALVYVPTTFDAATTAFQLVVHIHGFHNCIQQCVLPAVSTCNCSVGGTATSSYGLLDSFQAAADASAARGDGGLSQSLFVALEVR